jgi:hypothetical protein
MTRFQQAFNDMTSKHQELLNEFEVIHNQYVLEPEKFQTSFNQIGEKVVNIITDTENQLCATSEKGQYAKYSHNLADKFHELVRQRFPKIDDVGIEIEYVSPKPSTKPIKPPQPKTILDQPIDAILEDTLNSLKKTTLR